MGVRDPAGNDRLAKISEIALVGALRGE